MTIRRACFALAVAAAVVLAALPACARKLYAATAHDDPAAGESAGFLYVIDPGTGKARTVGPIRIDGSIPVAVDGLAVDPKTRVLYGITSGSSRPPSLITIDTRTAQAKLIGPLGARATDINFAANGALYTWLPDMGRLGVIDTSTGAVKTFAATGLAPTQAAGFTINSQGLAVVAARMSKGILDTVDPDTGNVVGGLALIDASVLNAVNALTLSPAGALFAVNSVKGAKTKRELVSIDTETGSITKIGALPDEVDALAFDHDIQDVQRSKVPLLIIMLALFIALNVVGVLRWRKPR